jgi:HD-like signal output (HDOD) protein
VLEHPEEQVEKIFNQLTDLPSLPETVEKLLQLSEKESTPRQFAELIATDQGLTAKVLRLVNSAFFALRKPISSIQHASILLGTRTLKSLVLSVSVLQLFRRGCGGFDARRFWRHSLSVAFAGQRLSERLRPHLQDDLYVAGLLHDCGVGLLAEHIPQEYALALRLAVDERRPLRAVELEIFGLTHADAGHSLVARWRLPELIGTCIRYHEHGALELDGAIGEPPVREAVEILQAAEGWIERSGWGLFAPGDPPELGPLVLPPWMGLTAADLDLLMGDVGEMVAGIERLLGVDKGPPVQAAAGT